MLSHRPNERRGLTLIELIIVIFIIGVTASVLFSVLVDFSRRQQLDTSAITLLNELTLTQEYAREIRNGSSYYGLRFYANLGTDSDRDGWKIVRYKPPGGPVDLGCFTVVKSSVAADNPEYQENTFFSRGVRIPASSELNITEAVVFNPEGSATNGTALLNATQDSVTLTMGQANRIINITALTGHARIQ